MIKKWTVIVVVLLGLGFSSIIFGGIAGLFISDPIVDGNVALISVSGVISASGGQFLQDSYSSASSIIDYIKKADENPKIKAIVLEINSPGGSPVASSEIARAIKRTNKTTIAWVREIAASGGYYVASAADIIIAHPMSITGSIGVIGSYLEYAGFLEDHNVTYRRLVAGKFKDAGSPWKELTPSEEKNIQSLIDKMYNLFVEDVATYRDMDVDTVKDLATGEVFIGKEALDLGLVDKLGDGYDVSTYLEKILGEKPKYVEYTQKPSFLNRFTGVISSYDMGRGIGDSFLKKDFNIKI